MNTTLARSGIVPPRQSYLRAVGLRAVSRRAARAAKACTDLLARLSTERHQLRKALGGDAVGWTRDTQRRHALLPTIKDRAGHAIQPHLELADRRGPMVASHPPKLERELVPAGDGPLGQG